MTHSIVSLVSIILLIIPFTTVVAQPGRKISRIEVEGLRRLAADEVVATSELKTGAPFSIAALDAAGQRLVDSGLFKKVGYRTRTHGSQMTVIFQVEEASGDQSPVIFDNFVWFTPEELFAAIRREVPSFAGNAADAGKMTDTITRALQNLLKERNIPGTVEYAPWQVSNTRQEHLFSVSGVPIPICSLHFPGAKNVPEEKLIRSSNQLTDADYSYKSAIAFGTFILSPLYRDAGQWRARFGKPDATFNNADKCKGGVHLTIPVTEGPIYLWDKAEWTGNKVLSQPELDAALGMKKNEVASGSRLEKGLFQVKRAYGLKGHLEAAVNEQPEFDDTASRMTFRIEVKEGPQYRMGNLLIKGLPQADIEALTQRWKLRTGEIFNAGYLDQYLETDSRELMRRIILERQAQGKGPLRMKHGTKLNRQTLTADVTVEFED
jgi:outer membrane protein assembly factor BamA